MPIPVAVVAGAKIAGFALQAVSTIGSLFGGMSAAKRQRRIGRQLANDARVRGEEDVFAFRGDAERLMGQQRVGLGGANIDLSQGSAKILQDQTTQFVERDVRQLRLNAAREARALRMGANAQATQLRSQTFTQAASNFGTLITQAPDAWHAYKTLRKP